MDRSWPQWEGLVRGCLESPLGCVSCGLCNMRHKGCFVPQCMRATSEAVCSSKTQIKELLRESYPKASVLLIRALTTKAAKCFHFPSNFGSPCMDTTQKCTGYSFFKIWLRIPENQKMKKHNILIIKVPSWWHLALQYFCNAYLNLHCLLFLNKFNVSLVLKYSEVGWGQGGAA
jgi:hypothetical protein